jgi:hypothetical protein
MLVYSNDEYLSRGLDLTEDQIAEFDQINDDNRRFMPRDLRKRGSEDRREDRESMFFPIYWDKPARLPMRSLKPKNGTAGIAGSSSWKWKTMLTG